MTVTHEVEFDRNDVLPTIRRAWSTATLDDAEDALQTAAVELLAKGTPLTAANVVTRGRSRLIAMKSRREATNLSLESFLEGGDDESPVELAVEQVDFDAHLSLAEFEDDPIMRERLRNVAAGASQALLPRGAACHSARHSDATVARVRRLRHHGGLTFKAIEEQTGVERSVAAQWCRGDTRVVPTSEGWTKVRIRTTVRRWTRRRGRPPTYADGQQDARLPNPTPVNRLFGSWRAMLMDAGCPSPYATRRLQPWSLEEAEREILRFVDQAGRWPNRHDLESDPQLPSPSTCGRLFRTQVPERLQRIIGKL